MLEYIFSALLNSLIVLTFITIKGDHLITDTLILVISCNNNLFTLRKLTPAAFAPNQELPNYVGKPDTVGYLIVFVERAMLP